MKPEIEKNKLKTDK